MRQNVGLTPQHQEHSHVSLAVFERFVHRSFQALPGGGRGGAVFRVHRRERSRDRQGIRGAFLKAGSEGEGPEAFADFELGLGKQVAALCRTVICKYIEDRDERGGPIHKDDKVFYRAARTQKTVHTLFGPVRYFRTRYRSEDGSFSPVDNDLGLRLSHEPGRLSRSSAPGPLHAAGNGQTLRGVGGHEPVVEPRVCWRRRAVSGRKRGGKPWKASARRKRCRRRRFPAPFRLMV